MKHLTTLIVSLIITLSINAQNTLKLSDFEILKNTDWKGQLTYTDYQSGSLTSIDANMQIEIKDEYIITNIQYVYEPNKNNTSKVKINKEGTFFGNEKVISNTSENGIRTFITSYEGQDDNKKATMFITHIFSENMYQVTKEVQYKNTNERVFRNAYKFEKL